MRYLVALVVASLFAVAVAVTACRPGPVDVPVEESERMDNTPVEVLKARVVSWDAGFAPATEAEWTARVVAEVRDASSTGVDVLVFPELFAAGLSAYAPNDRYSEFITRRMHATVLPAVKDAAGPMLVCLGSYAHQEAGWPHAFNRAPILIAGTWHFADKIHPTQREGVDDPPITAGDVLPVFAFRGGRVAVLVCFSLEMPEVATALKKDGVHLVLAPTATEDGDGVARILRCASGRAVELGAAVLVSPLLGRIDDWKNVGSAALYLPAQKGIDHQPRESVRRSDGIARDDFAIPWSALLGLRAQRPGKPETRPFLAERAFRVEHR